MSNLETKISELERELALKKGYQAVKFVLPKSLPDDVATEIQSKLREIAESLALKKDQLSGDDTPTTAASIFTAEESQALKLIAASVLKKTINPPTPPTNVLNETITPAKIPPVSKKAKLITTENVRGEAKKYATIDDEIFVSDPSAVDAHGMVAATHMKRGGMIKVPLDDIDFLS